MAVCDASQFCEQAGIIESAEAVAFCCFEAADLPGHTTVSVVDDKKVNGRLGGIPAKFMPKGAKTVCFAFVETLGFFCLF